MYFFTFRIIATFLTFCNFWAVHFVFMIFASNFNINTNQRNLVLFQVHYLMYVNFGILWGFQFFGGEIGGQYQNLRVIYFINVYYLDPMDQTQLKNPNAG